ncbi:MAG: ribbon-helix-helix protein, CopG family [Deltaproteobacteria bacterium]|nr:MAG: ribbon-helix-helix protein, CopG family [Deltaproteobacteria bacterium]
MEKMNVRLPIDVVRRLDDVAARTGKRKSDIVREALRRYISEERRSVVGGSEETLQAKGRVRRPSR